MAAGFLNSQIRFSGSVDPGLAGSTIEIERSGHQTGWTWTPTVHTQVRSDGTFSAAWQANHIGQFSVRAVASKGRGGGAAAGEPTVTMIVYRPAVATWYNQAGSTTACGVRLQANTLGVAHRTLPCGTKVAFYYHGKSIVVPVIDRGPYSGGRDWDLTEATASYLGMKQAGVVTLGSASLPKR
jgi:rare lipoprotein A